MKILHYTPQDKASILSEVLVTLLSGGTIVYPTETTYGLGADFYSPHAYRSIFAIKYRDEKKPLPVIVPDAYYATTLVSFSPAATQLASTYWPGPLTLILPLLHGRQCAHHLDPYLALRVSSHPFAASLAAVFGKPLISTSANVSGGSVCYSADEAVRYFERSRLKPDIIIDCGVLPHTPPSTIVKVENDAITIVREGAIKLPKMK